MTRVSLHPSYYAHIISGFFLLVSLFLLCMYFKKLIQLDPYKMIIVVLLFSLVFGIHGISHLGLESVYHFNPIEKIFQ